MNIHVRIHVHLVHVIIMMFNLKFFRQFSSLYQSSFLNHPPYASDSQSSVNPFVTHICELLENPKEKYQIQRKL